MKNKISPQKHKEFISIAATLPPLQKTDKNGNRLSRATSRPISFEDLPQTDKDKFYKELGLDAKKKRYIQRGSEPILVNHKLALIEAYENHGQGGVDRYVSRVQQMAEQKSEK